ncbi:MAG: hypothetical protein AMJ69_05635 [Gammaproteobacteria bacterium SG8_47]|nr:MAG: hypothetical protein AMJ69_05635 [Gammaproteobacteria bacterium SG8_47]
MPTAVVEARKGLTLSSVWIVPIVAAVIGLWLVYQALTQEGPTIQITFAGAEGIEAGKTKIRYKDVEVGEVSDVALLADLKGVVVSAKMHKSIESFLTSDTRFWVVRARLSVGGVSGLGTLLSGAYIAMDPGDGRAGRREFVGLEEPPALAQDRPGRMFNLRADSLGSLDVGSPLYFRQIKVGQVVEYHLDPGGAGVDISIFVDSPYDQFVRTATRFWNASGVDVQLSADGLEVNTGSLVSILIGGIAFETLPEDLAAPLAPADHGFELYYGRSEALEADLTEKRTWLLQFDGSVRGLKVGAPVEFRGIPMGRVTKVEMVFDPAREEFRIPVLVDLYTDRVGVAEGYDREEVLRGVDRDRVMADWVEGGLRAQLKTGNLLTGQLFVDLEFFPDAAPAQVKREGKYPELPTIPAPLQQITERALAVLAKVEAMPFDEIAANLNTVLKRVNATLVELETVAQGFSGSVQPELVTTLKEMQATLERAERFMRDDAPAQRDLRATLREVAEAARAVRLLAEQLERQPESLLRGKEAQ